MVWPPWSRRSTSCGFGCSHGLFPLSQNHTFSFTDDCGTQTRLSPQCLWPGDGATKHTVRADSISWQAILQGRTTREIASPMAPARPTLPIRWM